ncbi:MAG: hypothetical protein M3M91_04010 [Thermoproteota archaeon]|nr:hypothetical protein [Thermoproteota archaeon]
MSSSTIPDFSVTLNCNHRGFSCGVADNRRMGCCYVYFKIQKELKLSVIKNNM